MTSSLLRLPSPRFPADVATGEARIDGYLMRLDAALAGSAAVRRQTLLEARDFLLDASAGASDAALQAAIDAFGPAEQVASEQRLERRRLLISIGWRTGLTYAMLMLAMSLSAKASMARTGAFKSACSSSTRCSSAAAWAISSPM